MLNIFKNNLLKFFEHPNYQISYKTLFECSSNLQKKKIFDTSKILLKSLDQTIFHQSFKTLQSQKAYFQPINGNPNIIGEIGISSLLFSQHGLNSKESYNTLMHPRYYQNIPEIPYFLEGNPPDNLKELWYKETVYHEFGHAYQSYLKHQGQPVLSAILNDTKTNQESMWIQNCFPLNKYGIKSSNSKEKMRGYLATVYQEMYADNFGLICLGLEMNFSPLYEKMVYALQEAKKGNSSFSYNEKTHPFKYHDHSTYESVKHFNVNLVKNLSSGQSNSIYVHKYASENTIKGFMDFINILKLELPKDKVKIINEFETEMISNNLNTDFEQKLKLFRSNTHTDKKKLNL